MTGTSALRTLISQLNKVILEQKAELESHKQHEAEYLQELINLKQKKFESSTSETTELNTVIEYQKSQYYMLNEQFIWCQCQYQNALSASQENEKILNEYKLQLEKINSESSTMKTSVLSLQNDVATRNTEINRLKNQLTATDCMLNQFKVTLASSEDAKASCIAELQDSKSLLKTSLDSQRRAEFQQTSVINSLNEKIATLEKINSNNLEENNTLKIKIIDCEATINQYSILFAQYQSYFEQYGQAGVQYENQLSYLTQQNEETKRTMEKLELDRDEQINKIHEIYTLKLDSMEHHKLELETTISQMTKKLFESNQVETDLQRQLDQMRKQIDESEQVERDLKQQLDHLMLVREEQNEKIQNLVHQLTNSITERSELEARCGCKELELEKLQSNSIEWGLRCQSLANQLNERSNYLVELETVCKSKDDAIEALEKNYAELLLNRKILEDQLNDASKQVEESKILSFSKDGEIEELGNILSELRSKYHAIKIELNEILRDFESSTQIESDTGVAYTNLNTMPLKKFTGDLDSISGPSRPTACSNAALLELRESNCTLRLKDREIALRAVEHDLEELDRQLQTKISGTTQH